MNKNNKSLWVFICFLGLLGVFYISLYIKPSDSDMIVNKTTIVFNKTELDLGVIKYKEPKTVEYKFTNVGENKLVIYDIKPSCGCTNVDWTKGPIKSGESGKISVVYNAETTGRFEKSIVVYCNSDIENISLQISGEVIEE